MLAAVEVVLRLAGPAPPLPEDTLRTFTRHDPQLGWSGRPGAKGLYRTRRFETAVSLNSGGWRDDEFVPVDGTSVESLTEVAGVADSARTRAASKDRGSIVAGARTGDLARESHGAGRIVLLGDSFAWGFGVNRGEMFADRLERLLPGWEVRNYSVSGFGTDQELLVLRLHALADRPSLVIVEFAVENDLRNIQATTSYHLPKPRFVLEAGSLRLEGVPVPRVEEWERVARGDALKEFMATHVRLFAWARPRWAALTARIERAAGSGGSTAEMRRVRLVAREQKERLDRGWRLAEALFAEIRDEAGKVGARVVILDVPDRLQVDDALWTDAVRALRLDPPDYDRDLPENRLEAIGERLGVPVVRTLEALRRRMRSGESVYIADDIHWNARGHEVAAEELARTVRSMGLEPPWRAAPPSLPTAPSGIDD